MNICKIFPLDTPNQPSTMRSKEVSDSVYDTLEHSWKTNKRNEARWLLLTSLDKVVKEKDELRDLNSQLKCHTHDLKTSMCALKETLISYGHSAETAENQTGISSSNWLNYTTELPASQGVSMLKRLH